MTRMPDSSKHGLKGLPYWLKGGIIMALLDIFVISLVLITSSPYEADLLALYFFQTPFSGLAFLMGGNNLFFLITFGVTGWFLVGSIIGLIVGKFKSKR